MLLRTKRLLLRDFKPADFDAFYATTDDPDYRQFYPEEEMAEAHWREIFERILAAAKTPERLVYQLAICLPDGELVGTGGVRVEDVEHRQASIGVAIARRHWGHGLAHEAAVCLIDFAFSSLPVHRLYAETNGANRRAAALLEKLGMRPEGFFRGAKFFRGRWWDTAVYAILKDEWSSREPLGNCGTAVPS